MAETPRLNAGYPAPAFSLDDDTGKPAAGAVRAAFSRGS